MVTVFSVSSSELEFSASSGLEVSIEGRGSSGSEEEGVGAGDWLGDENPRRLGGTLWRVLLRDGMRVVDR